MAKLNGLMLDKNESVNCDYHISDEPMSDEKWAAEYGPEAAGAA
ncbi:hypothetical protein V5F49_06735 [Xanthobacter sp. V3C-3]